MINLGIFLEMKTFISKGTFGESLVETSSGSKRYLEIVAVGTDNYCFHKIRYTTQLAMHPNPISYALTFFEAELEVNICRV